VRSGVYFKFYACFCFSYQSDGNVKKAIAGL